MKRSLIVAWLLFSTTVFSAQWIELIPPGLDLTLYPARVAQLPLSQAWHVHKLWIEAIGMNGSAMFEVVVGNDIKGTIYVPGVDPKYVVTVETVTSVIQLWHTQGGAVRVSRLSALVSETAPPPPPSLLQKLRTLMDDTSHACFLLSHYLSPSIYISKIKPLDLGARWAKVAFPLDGPLSEDAHKRLTELLISFRSAEPSLKEMLANERLAPHAERLLVLQSRLLELIP